MKADPSIEPSSFQVKNIVYPKLNAHSSLQQHLADASRFLQDRRFSRVHTRTYELKLLMIRSPIRSLRFSAFEGRPNLSSPSRAADNICVRSQNLSAVDRQAQSSPILEAEPSFCPYDLLSQEVASENKRQLVNTRWSALSCEERGRELLAAEHNYG